MKRALLQGVFALREGPWKFVPVRGSGGFSFREPTFQLYNLATDPHGTHNVTATEAATATRIERRMVGIESTPATRP